MTACRQTTHLPLPTLAPLPGYTARRKINVEIINERVSYLEGFRTMLESVKRPFPEMLELVKRDVKLDPGFKEFYAYAKANDIPVVVVSSGMVPVIRAIFSNLIGEEEANKIDIIANEVEFTDPEKKGDTWKLVYRHPDNHFGHDKSKSILPYRELPNPPLITFAGDGISDMSAAAHADILFVKEKQDNDLKIYCDNKGIKYTLFDSWLVIKKQFEDIAAGRVSVDDLRKKPEPVA